MPSLSPAEAWKPLPPSEWDENHAKHLLRRATFSATPDQVDAALASGLKATVDRLFADRSPMPRPRKSIDFIEAERESLATLDQYDPVRRDEILRGLNVQQRDVFVDFGIRWLQRAADPRHAAIEKLTLCLQDVLVVSYHRIKSVQHLFDHQQTLRLLGLGPYPDLCKAITRQPAMIHYLDLGSSEVGQPNENFAREVMELFTLGEGNYTEDDIVEAARAFTGYGFTPEGFQFQPQRHDGGVKTVFGRRGRFSGDDVIDLIFQQDAAQRFLPSELIRFYLSDEPIAAEYVTALGGIWKASGFRNEILVKTLFKSRLFYEAAFRGNHIKSPIEFYLGLLADLELEVEPTTRGSLTKLQRMGQPFFRPPNVRGWIGGKGWINSSTLQARDAWVDYLVDPQKAERFQQELSGPMAPPTDPDGRYHATESHLTERLGWTQPEDLLTFARQRFAQPLTPHQEKNLAKAFDRLRNRRGWPPPVVGALVLVAKLPNYHLS